MTRQEFLTRLSETTLPFLKWCEDGAKYFEYFETTGDTKPPYPFIPKFEGDAQKLFELDRPENNNRGEYLSKEYVLSFMSENITKDWNYWSEDLYQFDTKSNSFFEDWEVSQEPNEDELQEFVDEFEKQKNRFMEEVGWKLDAWYDLLEQWDIMNIEGFCWDW